MLAINKTAMSDTSEREIFDCLVSNIKLAKAQCPILYRSPRRVGPSYEIMRKALIAVENCCRQACVWREDTRHLAIADKINQLRHKAGGWLRQKPPEVRHFPMMEKLLDMLLISAEMLKNRRTGRVGMILPEVMPVHRENRHVRVANLPPSMTVSKGGIILPAGL